MFDKDKQQRRDYDENDGYEMWLVGLLAAPRDARYQKMPDDNVPSQKNRKTAVYRVIM